MKTYITLILISGSVLLLSSCVYYRGMPKDWTDQVSEVHNFGVYNGTYVLHDDNESLQMENDYNDLRYLQNISLYSVDSIKFPWLTSITLNASEYGVFIKFYSGERLVHQSRFKGDDFKLKNNVLTLNMNNHTEHGGLVALYMAPVVQIYKGVENELIVKRKETGAGTVCIFPAIAGQNLWFKIRKVGGGMYPAPASEYPARNTKKLSNHGLESTSAPPAAGTLETHP